MQVPSDARLNHEEGLGGSRTADTGLTESGVPAPDSRQRAADMTQDEGVSVEETRPRLRSRRDGRMSAAGRLAEQAAEAAAAAGWAADGTLLVVSAHWRNEFGLSHSILVLDMYHTQPHQPKSQLLRRPARLTHLASGFRRRTGVVPQFRLPGRAVTQTQTASQWQPLLWHRLRPSQQEGRNKMRSWTG